jgi:hypothetical protein
MGVHLMGIIGMHFIGVHLIGMCLTGVHLMGVYFTGAAGDLGLRNPLLALAVSVSHTAGTHTLRVPDQSQHDRQRLINKSHSLLTSVSTSLVNQVLSADAIIESRLMLLIQTDMFKPMKRFYIQELSGLWLHCTSFFSPLGSTFSEVIPLASSHVHDLHLFETEWTSAPWSSVNDV